MFTFRFGVDDLAATWFSCSPLQETVLSLRARRSPTYYPEQQPWIVGWQSRYETLDTVLLASLAAPSGFVPDFLTPRPAVPRPEFAAELAGMAATPPEVARADVLAAYRGDGSPVPPVLAELLDDPSRLVARAAEALEAYWTRCLAPAWWPRARSVLESDIVYRGRMLSERGAEGLFADLDYRLSWRSGVLTLDDEHPATRALGTSVDLAGRGLVLMPTLFGRGAQTDITQVGPPLVCYPARGKATMAEGLGTYGRAAMADGPLTALIGVPRARLLAMLETPASTTELAHRLGVTPGAVSRHLTALTAAGLLERNRHGRSVLYGRSGLGDALVAGVPHVTAGR
ncbi:helix-turn-helix domain-containing protein [Kitasatospora sp. NPDC056446]|uniref:ArsR/SmtB family transcription factor n=1 Tax=Kitasatospora sp. NPDC056446 TaxID=3345819 RepID=UPI00367A5366